MASNPRSRVVSFLKGAAAWVLFLLVIGGSFFVFGERLEAMPPHALVLVDDKTHTYFAPPFFSDNGVPMPADARCIPAAEAREKGYRPDDRCRGQGYFTQEHRSLLWSIFGSEASRWKPDGTWSW